MSSLLQVKSERLKSWNGPTTGCGEAYSVLLAEKSSLLTLERQ